MPIQITEQEVQAVIQRLAEMPYEQVAELVNFFQGKVNANASSDDKPTEE